MKTEFEKTITFQPAYDKRDPNPSKNYGIHGVTIRFVLQGELGATQFVLYTDWHLPHVQKELSLKPYSPFRDGIKPIGADIGYHAYKPQYEGQQPMDKCDILGVLCYYDGSGLRATEFIPQFLAGGDEAVWKMLREEYDHRFIEKQQEEARP